MSAAHPLEGITVLDLTRLLPGPAATMHLADMGATVIKIEDRGIGDYARTMSHVRNTVSQLFIAVNRGKQFVQLDLKDPVDHQRFLQMVETADLVVESFRPGVMKKLGLDWTVLKARNPKLVMCAISGYGQDGPLALEAGHDINYIAVSGMLAQNTDDNGRPVLPNLQIGDLLGGAQSALQGMLAALLAAKINGQGRYVDVSMTDAVFAHNIMPLLAFNQSGKTAAPARDFLTGGLPCYKVYRTSDDRYMAVGALEYKFWQSCCRVLGREDLSQRHWSLGQTTGGTDALAVIAELEVLFLQHPLQHWIALFAPADCCVTPVLTTEEACRHPHFIARQMAQQADYPGEGPYIRTGPCVKFSD